MGRAALGGTLSQQAVAVWVQSTVAVAVAVAPRLATPPGNFFVIMARARWQSLH